MSEIKKVCVIGAGCSGLTMAKRLNDFSIDYDQFEASDNVGGNWYFNNPNGMSSCYQSLHIDTSKFRLAFEDFPVPQDWPDFPHHSQILRYFHDYCDHFGLRDGITFDTKVEDCWRDENELWHIRLSSGEMRSYENLVVCNGHHWNPKTPTEYPGEFSGIQFHSHYYRSPFEPYDLRGKRVLVVGVGNSAMDIASEVSQRHLAERLFVSARRGVWVLPKYMHGKPVDKGVMPAWVPEKLGLAISRSVLKRAIGKMEDYGLPKPDHELLTAHPSVSGEFLTRLGCGDILVRPGIRALDGDSVKFTDGAEEKIDVIIWATGYHISFPFLKQKELAVEKNRFPLYRRLVKPGWNNLFFLGLAQSLPTLVNLGEQQSKYVVAILRGKHELPSESEMERIIVDDEKRYLGNFYDSERHTIQVDFTSYVRDLEIELKDSGSWG